MKEQEKKDTKTEIVRVDKEQRKTQINKEKEIWTVKRKKKKK